MPPTQRPHVLYASSSSVYGLNTRIPFHESHAVDEPANLYGATKLTNELVARAYHNLHGLPSIGCRFFTVYGPWGRPDMAISKFTNNIMKGMPIPVFNGGDMQRDYTYVEDIVDGVTRLMQWRDTRGHPQVRRRTEMNFVLRCIHSIRCVCTCGQLHQLCLARTTGVQHWQRASSGTDGYDPAPGEGPG